MIKQMREVLVMAVELVTYQAGCCKSKFRLLSSSGDCCQVNSGGDGNGGRDQSEQTCGKPRLVTVMVMVVLEVTGHEEDKRGGGSESC